MTLSKCSNNISRKFSPHNKGIFILFRSKQQKKKRQFDNRFKRLYSAKTISIAIVLAEYISINLSKTILFAILLDKYKLWQKN